VQCHILTCIHEFSELSRHNAAEPGWYEQTVDCYKSADIREVDQADGYVQNSGEQSSVISALYVFASLQYLASRLCGVNY